jgi:hypothetical protein
MLDPIDEFVEKLKASHRPKKYENEVEHDFLISYDEPTKAINGDFRLHIIAALLLNNATNLESYVASTIQFKTKIDSIKPGFSVRDWEDYLLALFGEKFCNLIVIIDSSKFGTLYAIANPNPGISAEFRNKVNEIKSKI